MNGMAKEISVLQIYPLSFPGASNTMEILKQEPNTALNRVQASLRLHCTAWPLYSNMETLT